MMPSKLVDLFLVSLILISCSSAKPHDHEEAEEDATVTEQDIFSDHEEFEADATEADADVSIGDEDVPFTDEDAGLDEEKDEEEPFAEDDVTLQDQDEIETDTIILDDDARPDTDTLLPDSDVDDPPGLNSRAFQFQGIMRDIDPVEGGVLVYGGSPNTLYRCLASTLNAVQCTKIADIPTTGTAVTYLSGPFGGIATAEEEGTGSPFEIFHIDEQSSTPATALLGSITVSGLTIGSGSDEISFELYHPIGIGVHRSAQAPTDRFFIAVSEAINEGASTGLLLSYADQDGDWANEKMPGLPKGRGTAGMATALLDLGDGPKAYLVALNAGVIDTTDTFEAGISVFDMDASSVLRVKNIPLGEVELAALPEISFDAIGTSVFVPVMAPDPSIRRINLESGTEGAGISLEGLLAGAIADMTIGEDTLYIADTGGAILFFDIATSTYRGQLFLPESPTALAVSGEYLYAVVGEWLYVMEKNIVE